jgi:hypothetical protein
MRVFVALFLALGMVAIVWAQPGSGMGGGFGAGATYDRLVRNEAVQEELKLSDEQVTQVNDWAKDFVDKAKKIRKDNGIDFEGGSVKKGGGFGAGQLPPQLGGKMAAANAEINKQALKELGKLLMKEQVARLKEISIQVHGLEAFTSAEVANPLKLTNAQKTSIGMLSADLAKERRAMMQAAGGFKGGADKEKLQDAMRKFQKVQQTYIDKAIDALSDAQKKTWKTLVGEPFDTSNLIQ